VRFSDYCALGRDRAATAAASFGHRSYFKHLTE
jgi:hypothetical protein